MYIFTINQTDAAHLETVKAEMRTLGAPTLRAIRDEMQGIILLLEGTHRFAAAIELGLVPTLILLADEDMISCDDIGYDDCGWFDGEPATAIDIRDRIASPRGDYTDCIFHKIDAEQVVVRNA